MSGGADSYSISRRLARQLAWQTALALALLCGVIFGTTWMLVQRKLDEAWDAQRLVVQEIVLYAWPKGEARVLEMLQFYASRRPGTHVQLWRSDGSRLYADPEPAFDPHRWPSRRGSFVLVKDGVSWRGELALDARADARLLSAMALKLLLVALGGGLVVGCGVNWRVRRGLAPMQELAAQTRAIQPGALGQRLRLSEPIEELLPAVSQFNLLMDRLERAYQQLEGFNADVAHELRTPLAALIGHTELALSKPRDADSLRDTLVGNLEALQRLSAMVNDMLFLAQADRGAQARRGEPVSLARLAQQVSEFHEAQLDEAQLQLHIDGDAQVAVDEALLKRALSNLIGNATRYAAPGSQLRVQIADCQPEGEVRIEVENQGPAIDAQAMPRLFDRFFRADSARSDSQSHQGLGLAIVSAIARMHAGRTLAASSGGATRIGFTVAR